MKKFGKKQLTLHLQEPMTAIRTELADWPLSLKANGHELEYTVDVADSVRRSGVRGLVVHRGIRRRILDVIEPLVVSSCMP